MAKKKRKPRKVMAPQLDVMKPLLLTDIYALGGKDDPCFAKLYDPKAPECRRCGDIEICAIAFGQNLHTIRKEVEEKGNFLDLEEEAIDKLTDKQKAKKLIRRLVNANQTITVENVKKQAMAGIGITEKEFNSILTKLLKTSSKYKLMGNKLTLS